MDRGSDRNKKLIYNLIYIAFVFSLVYLFSLVIGLQKGFSSKVLIIIIESLIVKFLLFNPFLLYIILAIGFIVALLVNHYITPFIPPFVERVILLFDNIISNLKGEERIATENTLIFWLILIVLVSLFTALIVFKGKRIYILLPIYLGFFLYYWYNFLDQAYQMIFIFLLAFLILMGLESYSKEKKNSDESQIVSLERLYIPWLQTALTYSILIVFIALLIPKGYNYIRWSWLQNKVYETFPMVADLRSYNTFSRGVSEAKLFDFTTTGFQNEPSRLGGPVNLSNQKIMTLFADDTTYLRGNIKQVYRGNYWDSITEPSETYRLREDFSGLSKEQQRSFYRETNIAITNHEFASRTLFSPYMPISVDFQGNHWVEVNNDYSMILSSGVYNYESYFVKALKPLPYGILRTLDIDSKIEDIPNLELYVQIPENKISDRTRNLVKDIVKEKESDFEKAKAIEGYLRNNYKYNLNVGNIPEGHEFIDYFLFEEKEGYCTYYATSMAIMLRLEGIPSRYVEGYLANEPVEKGKYEIKHSDAHAWVEAFIEPVGWMVFEPTSAYDIENRMENYQKSTGEVNNPNNPLDSDNSPRRPRDLIKIVDDGELDIWEPGSEGKSNDISKPFTRNIVYFIIIVLISIIPLRFLYSLICFILNERRVMKYPNDERIIYLYKQILIQTELLGYPQRSGETHYEYANRVAYKFYDRDNKGIKEITDIFVKSKYSSYIPSDDDVEALLNYRRSLDNRLKNHLGPLKRLGRFFLFKHIIY